MPAAMYYRICPCKTKVPCTNGLEQIRCPKCGRPVDRSWPRYKMEDPLPDADGTQAQPTNADEQARGDKTAVEETQPRQIQSGPAQEAPPLLPLAGRRPEIRRLRGGTAPDAEDAPAQAVEPRQDGVCLDYFGEKIRIPAGSEIWIGREGLGRNQLEGNLLVSREHVKAHVDRAGRLFVEDVKSLNGTWVTKDHVKKRLEYGETVILGKGDILWLYNLPLMIGAE